MNAFSPDTPRVFRFAPSPNGALHLGHAYSAMMNRICAARCGGTVLLRMENIDSERCRPAFEVAIANDLRWLGFTWKPPVWRQSERLAAYRSVLERLDRKGLVYPCFCTRGDIARAVDGRPDWPRDPDGAPLYPGTCRHLSRSDRQAREATGMRAAHRLDMKASLACCPDPLFWDEFGEGPTAAFEEATPAVWGDVLLARRDVATSYHLAVVADDEAQAVTDVVRGQDLRQATSLHRLLQCILGFSEPAYHHHRLVLDSAGRKLSKSQQAPALRDLRVAGLTATAVLQRLDLPLA